MKSIFYNFGMILVCLISGALLRQRQFVDDSVVRILNRGVIYVALPATALLGLHAVPLDRSIWVPASMAWILFAMGCLVFSAFGRIYRWPRDLVGAVVLTGALSNTSFLGFPLLLATVGSAAIPVGVVADQLGSFAVLATLATVFAIYCGGRRLDLLKIAKTLVTFPPLLAVVLAMSFHDVSYPHGLENGLKILSATLAPMSLLAVGMTLRPRGIRWRRIRVPLLLGLFYKLVAGPALIVVIFRGVGIPWGLMLQVTILEAAMAPMITGSVLANETGMDRELTGAMMLLGIPLSLISVPIWYFLLPA